MKEVINSPPELEISSLSVKVKSHGSHYQKETVSISPQLKLKLLMKEERKRKLIDIICQINDVISYFSL